MSKKKAKQADLAFATRYIPPLWRQAGKEVYQGTDNDLNDRLRRYSKQCRVPVPQVHYARRLHKMLLIYGSECVWCRQRVPDVQLNADHVIPNVTSQTRARVNMVPACYQCNNRRGHKPVHLWIAMCRQAGLEPNTEAIRFSLQWQSHHGVRWQELVDEQLHYLDNPLQLQDLGKEQDWPSLYVRPFERDPDTDNGCLSQQQYNDYIERLDAHVDEALLADYQLYYDPINAQRQQLRAKALWGNHCLWCSRDVHEVGLTAYQLFTWEQVGFLPRLRHVSNLALSCDNCHDQDPQRSVLRQVRHHQQLGHNVDIDTLLRMLHWFALANGTPTAQQTLRSLAKHYQ